MLMAKGKQILHKTMRGKTIDMEILAKRNELTPAMGNARTNARGDLLGPAGKIIKKREDIIKEHYAKTARDERGTATPSKQQPVADTIEEELTDAELEMLADEDEWIEDEDGNFVQKGE
jgi:hypothetical protein